MGGLQIPAFNHKGAEYPQSMASASTLGQGKMAKEKGGMNFTGSFVHT